MKNKLGFTLVEQLVALAAGSIILLGVLAAINNISKSQIRTFKSYNLSSVGQNIIGEITTNTHKSHQVEILDQQLILHIQDYIILYYLDEYDLFKLDTQTGEVTQLNPNQIPVINFTVLDRTPPHQDPEATPTPLFDLSLELQNQTKGIPKNNQTFSTSLSIRQTNS